MDTCHLKTYAAPVKLSDVSTSAVVIPAMLLQVESPHLSSFMKTATARVLTGPEAAHVRAACWGSLCIVPTARHLTRMSGSTMHGTTHYLGKNTHRSAGIYRLRSRSRERHLYYQSKHCFLSLEIAYQDLYQMGSSPGQGCLSVMHGLEGRVMRSVCTVHCQHLQVVHNSQHTAGCGSST